MFRTVSLAALLLIVPTTQALAWGQEGHSIVAEIAQRRLEPAAAAAVIKILGPNVSLASVSEWADDVKFTIHKDTYNWHFVDIPLSRDAYDEKLDCKLVPGKGDCAIAAIDRLEKGITCATTGAERADDLKYLVHIVADVQQPMHTVEDNVGENNVKVTISGMKGDVGDTNADGVQKLHVIWDTTLIMRAVFSWGSFVDRLEGGWLQSSHPAGNDLDPVHWVNGAHKLAQDAVVANGATIGQDYYTTQIKVVEQQLGLGGLRLAGVLNKYLADSPACPF